MLNSQEQRQQYVRGTGFRLLENAYGVYDGEPVFETMEVVTETTTMTIHEMRKARLLHMLLQLLWGRRWYYELLKAMKAHGCDPMTFVELVAESLESADADVKHVISRYKSDLENENFPNPAALFRFWSNPSQLERLRKGEIGDLKEVYTYELLSHRSSLASVLMMAIGLFIRKTGLDSADSVVRRMKSVLAYCEERHVSFDQQSELIVRKSVDFSFDILGWEAAGYIPELARTFEVPITYELYLSDSQHRNLIRQLRQFEGDELKVTLRNMTLDASAEQFRYRVRRD